MIITRLEDRKTNQIAPPPDERDLSIGRKLKSTDLIDLTNVDGMGSSDPLLRFSGPPTVTQPQLRVITSSGFKTLKRVVFCSVYCSSTTFQLFFFYFRVWLCSCTGWYHNIIPIEISMTCQLSFRLSRAHIDGFCVTYNHWFSNEFFILLFLVSSLVNLPKNRFMDLGRIGNNRVLIIITFL